MDDNFKRERLVEQYRAFVTVLETKGILYTPVSDRVLNQATLSHLQGFVEKVKDHVRAAIRVGTQKGDL